MKSEQRKVSGPGFEHYEEDINWTAGAGRPAGVYWMNGRTTIVAHDSAAEDRLLGAGAILIATLRFDRDPLDGVQRGRTVERRSATQLSREFLLSSVN